MCIISEVHAEFVFRNVMSDVTLVERNVQTGRIYRFPNGHLFGCHSKYTAKPWSKSYCKYCAKILIKTESLVTMIFTKWFYWKFSTTTESLLGKRYVLLVRVVWRTVQMQIEWIRWRRRVWFPGRDVLDISLNSVMEMWWKCNMRISWTFARRKKSSAD